MLTCYGFIYFYIIKTNLHNPPTRTPHLYPSSHHRHPPSPSETNCFFLSSPLSPTNTCQRCLTGAASLPPPHLSDHHDPVFTNSSYLFSLLSQGHSLVEPFLHPLLFLPAFPLCLLAPATRSETVLWSRLLGITFCCFVLYLGLPSIFSGSSPAIFSF